MRDGKTHEACRSVIETAGRPDLANDMQRPDVVFGEQAAHAMFVINFEKVSVILLVRSDRTDREKSHARLLTGGPDTAVHLRDGIRGRQPHGRH
jgi:hypothetical protein